MKLNEKEIILLKKIFEQYFLDDENFIILHHIVLKKEYKTWKSLKDKLKDYK